ncbi:isochorismatase [Maioricimonas sp. JC845]|uniref:isochorismatase n=1 Tax=Maioricimonas sp. JC845 TaxID=3232138 RepID=UPI0034591F82
MTAPRFSYRPRAFRFLELWRPGDWAIKVYGIAYEGERPNAVLVDAAKRLARTQLIDAPAGHYSVGFLGVHAGKTGNFLFVSWWSDENELNHHVWTSSLESPERFECLTPRGIIACVWDLQLLCFERQAWIETALQPQQADLDAYLARRFAGDV